MKNTETNSSLNIACGGFDHRHIVLPTDSKEVARDKIVSHFLHLAESGQSELLGFVLGRGAPDSIRAFVAASLSVALTLKAENN